ncbi:MAG: hypothetical protein LKG27_07565 [Clostridiaceae bacterium]|jgi:hypothetical protein|nr:hypothetical protein [Clostridiaceae bacterium]
MNEYQKRLEERRNVASLIRFVLIGELCVREAIKQFPPDTEDESIEAAYHALIHYEADEDLRRKDNIYKEQQDDYVEMIANTLERGENLPQNIIANYKKYYKSANIPHSKTRLGFWKSFLRYLNI